MKTHHIKPTSRLAIKALPLVQEIFKTHGDVLVAVRGQEFVLADGNIDEWVQTVKICPYPDQVTSADWLYVSAKDWLEQYETPQFGVADLYGREVFSTRFKTLKEAKDALQAFILGSDDPKFFQSLVAHDFSS
jgi:hypothetical protein